MKIELKDIVFSYRKKLDNVIKGISCSFESGNLYVLIGDNGCGKTTLTKLILGLNKQNSGDIFINDENVRKIKAGERSKNIGYLFQNPDLQLFAPTVYDELSFPFEIAGCLDEEKKKKIAQLLDDFSLKGMEERFPLEMSGGEKQRLALTTIMIRDVKFLILDEPTSSVDEEGREYIKIFINNFVANGGGAVVITHDEDLVSGLENARILKMQGGKIYED